MFCDGVIAKERLFAKTKHVGLREAFSWFLGVLLSIRFARLADDVSRADRVGKADA